MAIAKRILVSDLKVPASYSLDTTGITQGLLAVFATCRQKFLFRINGYRPKNQNKDALLLGSFFHDLLENFYKSPNKNKFMNSLDHFIFEYVKKNKLTDNHIIQDKVRAMITVYSEVYGDELLKMIPLRVEEVFGTKTSLAKLRGRKDLTFRYRKSKQKWMMEHKTKSRIDHDFLTFQLAFDLQNHFYDQHEIIEHKEPYAGIVYNIIRTPQLRPKKTETRTAFYKRMLQDIRTNYRDYFLRFNLTLSAGDRKRFGGELQLKLFEIREYLKGRLAHYRNESACLIPYRCEYLEACSSGNLSSYEKHSIIFPELED